MVAVRQIRVPVQRTQSQDRARRAPGHGPRRRPRAAAPAAMLTALLGWCLAGALFVLVLVTLKSQRDQAEAIRAQLPQQIAAIKTDVPVREQQITAEKRNLTDQINAAVKEQERLLQQIAGREQAVGELQERILVAEGDAQKLKEHGETLREATAKFGDSLETLQATIDRLTRGNETLKARYRKRFLVLKDEFDRRQARPEAEPMRQFFMSHRHTVFAPAAAFDAAEKMYSRRRSDDALRLYAELVRRFPTSSYAGYAEQRLAQIKDKTAYQPLEPAPDFEPYHPPLAAE